MRRGASGINCLIALDKPVGPSSHDVVGKVRRALGERRVGHAGTLDPAASGVLVVGVGQGTRLLGLLALDEKVYEARITFGFETSTDDVEGEVTATAAVPRELLSEPFARAAAGTLVGTLDQVPPAFSAISVGGRRAYERSRAGERVELAARQVRVHEARLLSVEVGDAVSWNVRLRVSKGTYVRSVARDLGRALGSAAHLSALRRVSSGPVGIDLCLGLAELAERGRAVVPGRCLDPLVALGLAVRSLSPDEHTDVVCGRRIAAGLCVERSGSLRAPREGELVSLVSGDALMGVWRRRGDALVSQSTFPAGIMGVRRAG